ncbi:hypothetical protein NOI20_10390 [Rhodobacteraceae bacterium 10Alg 79]|uniref:Uncharacterized protein n=1 Tax=Rhodalgimonas zhirmunskyi TaxID=2964767 RepID=A0AAJ1UED5_9RHOB|nr:hypothetical protein [Rhodoalgimonas zhirmunskyi]
MREDLMERARAEGVTPEIAAEVAALVSGESALCTCSTLGAVAESAGALRIDRPAMRMAAKSGRPVLVAFCLESTRAATLSLLAEEMARAQNPNPVQPISISQAWVHFERGDHDCFVAAIAEGIEAVLVDVTPVIVLAQASMAGAAPRLSRSGVQVLTTPEAALRAAMKSA